MTTAGSSARRTYAQGETPVSEQPFRGGVREGGLEQVAQALGALGEDLVGVPAGQPHGADGADVMIGHLQFGRTWPVVVQARGEYRTDPDKVKQLKVRNARGEMVPLGSVLSIREEGGPINIARYNLYPAAAILGATKPAASTGEGIEEMERLCAEVLPPGLAFEWTEINYCRSRPPGTSGTT
jgi:hypothetical protein